MIMREMRPVSVVSYTSGTDAYGQKRKSGLTSRNVDMVLHQYSQNNITDVRYAEIDYIGLTEDRTIVDENEISFDGIRCIVKYTIPSGRYLQVFLRKV